MPRLSLEEAASLGLLGPDQLAALGNPFMPRAGASWTPTLGARPGIASSSWFRYPSLFSRPNISPLRFGLGGLGQGLTLSPESPALGLAGLAAPVGRSAATRSPSYGVAGGVAGGIAGGRAGIGAEGGQNYQPRITMLPDGRRLVTYQDGRQAVLPPPGRTGQRPVPVLPENYEELRTLGLLNQGVGTARAAAQLLAQINQSGAPTTLPAISGPDVGGMEVGALELAGLQMGPQQLAALGELGINTGQPTMPGVIQPFAGTVNLPTVANPALSDLDRLLLDIGAFGQAQPKLGPAGIPLTGFGEIGGGATPLDGGANAEAILGDAARSGMFSLTRPEDIYPNLMPEPMIGAGRGRDLDPRGLGIGPRSEDIFGDSPTTGGGVDLNVTPSNTLGLLQSVLGAGQGVLAGDPVQTIKALLQSGTSLADIGRIPGIGRYLAAAGAPVNLVQAIMQGNVPGAVAAAPGLINTFGTLAPESFAQVANSLGLSTSQLGALGGIGGVLGGGYGLYNAAQNGDPLGITMNALQLYSGAVPLINSLAGTSIPTLGSLGSQALTSLSPALAGQLGVLTGGPGVGALGGIGATLAPAVAGELAAAAAPSVGAALTGGTVAGIGTGAAGGAGLAGAGAGLGAGVGAGVVGGIVALPAVAAYLVAQIDEMVAARAAFSRARANRQRFERGLPTIAQDITRGADLMSTLTPQASDEQLLDTYNKLITVQRNWEGGPATGNPRAPSFPSMIGGMSDAGRTTMEQIQPYLVQVALAQLRAQDLLEQRGVALPPGATRMTPQDAAKILGGATSAYDPESGSFLGMPNYLSTNPWMIQNYLKPSAAEYYKRIAIFDPELGTPDYRTISAWSPEALSAFQGLQPGGTEAGVRALLGLPSVTYGWAPPVQTEQYGRLNIPTFAPGPNYARDLADWQAAQQAAATQAGPTAFDPLGFLSALQGGQRVNIQAGPETLTFIPYKPDQAATYQAKDSGYQQLSEGYYVKPSGQQALEVYVPQDTTPEALGKALSGSQNASQQALTAALAVQPAPAGQEAGATPGAGPAADIAPTPVPAGTQSSTPQGSAAAIPTGDSTPVPGSGGFQKGGVVPETGRYLVHKGEVVIPADKADTEAESQRFLEDMRSKGELRLEGDRTLQMPRMSPGRLDRGFGPGPDGGSQPDDEAKAGPKKWYVNMREGTPTQDLDGTDPSVRRLAFTMEDVQDALDNGEAPIMVGKGILTAPPSLQFRMLQKAQDTQNKDPMKAPGIVAMAARMKQAQAQPTPEGDTLPFSGMGDQVLRGRVQQPRFPGDKGRGADQRLEDLPGRDDSQPMGSRLPMRTVPMGGTSDRMPTIRFAPSPGNPFMTGPARPMTVAQNIGQDQLLRDLDTGVARPGTLREAIGTQKRYLTPQDLMRRPVAPPPPGTLTPPAPQPGILEQAIRRLTG